MSQELAVAGAAAPAVPKLSYATVPMDKKGSGGTLAPQSLGEVVAFAQVMARADLALPKHLRGNDGACMAVAMQAMRWEMDPFAVANKSYCVNDRLAFEAQLVAAVVHTRAPITGRPDYAFEGEGATRRCRVTCTMKDGASREYVSPTFGQITTKNSPLWKSDPDQQLGYFAIRSWARRHTPEVILGVYTPDEVETFRDVSPPRPTESGLRARLSASTAEGPRAGFSPAPDDDTTSSEPSPNTDDEGGGAPHSGEAAAPQAFDGDGVEIALDTSLDGAGEDAVLVWVELYRGALKTAVDEGAVVALRKAAFDAGQLKAVHALDAKLQSQLDREATARVAELKKPAEPPVSADDDEFPGDVVNRERGR